MTRTPVVGVVGERAAADELYEIAREVGRQIAERRGVVVCGGLTGVMEAACRGCREAGGTSIGILPGNDATEANEYVTIAIPTGMGEGRNILLVRSSDVLIAIGGSYGTLSEIALALCLSVPVIGVRTWRMTPGTGAAAAKDPIVRVNSAHEAVAAAWRHIEATIK